MKAPHRFCALIAIVESFLRRHGKITLTLLLLVVGIEGARLVVRDKMGDFKAIRQGAVRLARGDSLYQPREGRSYPYSPAMAIALLPLAFLPLGVAKALWYALSVLVIVVACRIATRILWPDRRPPDGFTLLMLSGSLYFGHNALLHGQPTPLMVMLCLLGYDLDGRGRPVLAGLCVAAATVIKPFPVLFLLFWILRNRWRSAIAFAISTAALLAIPAIVLPGNYGETLRNWGEVVRQQQELYDLTGATNHSVSAFWNRLFGVARPSPLPAAPTLPNALIVLSMASLLGISSWAAIRARGREGTVAAFGLFMICWAALPPLGWKHYYFTLLLPCAVVSRIAFESGAWGRWANLHLLFGLACVATMRLGTSALWMGMASFAFLAVYALRWRALSEARPPC